MTFLCRCKVPLFTYVLRDYAEVIKVLFYGILERPRPLWSFPSGTSGKEPICQCRRHERFRFDPWVGKIPEGGHGRPFQYSCLEKPMDRRAWQTTVHSVAKSQTWLKRLSRRACRPLQYFTAVKQLLLYVPWHHKCKSIEKGFEIFFKFVQKNGRAFCPKCNETLIMQNKIHICLH